MLHSIRSLAVLCPIWLLQVFAKFCYFQRKPHLSFRAVAKSWGFGFQWTSTFHSIWIGSAASLFDFPDNLGWVIDFFLWVGLLLKLNCSFFLKSIAISRACSEFGYSAVNSAPPNWPSSPLKYRYQPASFEFVPVADRYWPGFNWWSGWAPKLWTCSHQCSLSGQAG